MRGVTAAWIILPKVEMLIFEICMVELVARSEDFPFFSHDNKLCHFQVIARHLLPDHLLQDIVL